MCGIVGIYNHPDSATLAYLALYAQQHRGQESTGIVSLQDEKHLEHKGLGLVGEVFTEEKLSRLHGSAALGHNRYSTTGENLLNNAQPLTAKARSKTVNLSWLIMRMERWRWHTMATS